MRRSSSRRSSAAVSVFCSASPSKRISSTRTRSADFVARLVDVLEHRSGALAQLADLQHALRQLAGLVVADARGEHVLDVAHGLVWLVQVQLEPGQAQLELEGFVPFGRLEPPLEQRRQLLVLVLSNVQPIERAVRALVQRIDGRDALVVAESPWPRPR